MGKKKVLSELHKDINALTKKCHEEKGTFFGILSEENENGIALNFCGDPKILTFAFEEMLNRACDFEKEDKRAMDIANAIFNAIERVLVGEDVKKSLFLATVLREVMEKSVEDKKSKIEKMLDKLGMNVDCLDCDDFQECLGRKLEAQQNKENRRNHRRNRNKK